MHVTRIGSVVAMGLLAVATSAMAQGAKPSPAMDRDMIEVTVPQLHSYYADRKYSVTQVVQWYLDRIKKYDGIYKRGRDGDGQGSAGRGGGGRFRPHGRARAAVGRAHRDQGQHLHRGADHHQWLGGFHLEGP